MKLTAPDKIEIQELSNKYALAMDSGDTEAWLATWADEGTWTGAIGTFAGIENLKLVLPKLAERLKGKRHVMTNFVIDGKGDLASQECYLLIVDKAKQVPPGVAVYSDKLQKIKGEWRFVQRSVKVDQA